MVHGRSPERRRGRRIPGGLLGGIVNDATISGAPLRMTSRGLSGANSITITDRPLVDAGRPCGGGQALRTLQRAGSGTLSYAAVAQPCRVGGGRAHGVVVGYLESQR